MGVDILNIEKPDKMINRKFHLPGTLDGARITRQSLKDWLFSESQRLGIAGGNNDRILLLELTDVTSLDSDQIK